MYLKTSVSVLALLFSAFGSLIWLGVGLWVWQRTKSRCLPWVIACWGIGSPLLSMINSWVVNYVWGVSSKTNQISLSEFGLFSKTNAIAEYMIWAGLFNSLSSLLIAVLIAADVTWIVHQWKPVDNDRLPRFLGLVTKFPTMIGLLALGLAIVSHLMWLMAPYLAP